MIVKLYEPNPSEREVRKVVDALERGELIVYPTDSLYAVGCSLRVPKGIERLRRLKGSNDLTLICENLAQVAEYGRVDNTAFRLMKRHLPGPFTFLLSASSRIPDKALERRRTIGIRIPDRAIARAIVSMLGVPMLSMSVELNELEPEYTTDPELLAERYEREVSVVVDGGPGGLEPTTIVDLTDEEPVVVREGKGVLD